MPRFSRNNVSYGTGETSFANMEELLKSRFLSLYCMVMADGVIEAKELETLYRIGQQIINA